MGAEWANFYIAAAGAAAGLTGLLFVALSLRPREIRGSPVMVGRARAALYAFLAVMFTAFSAPTAAPTAVVGAIQLVVAVGIIGLSLPFTVRAHRARQLNYRRAFVYHQASSTSVSPAPSVPPATTSHMTPFCSRRA